MTHRETIENHLNHVWNTSPLKPQLHWLHPPLHPLVNELVGRSLMKGRQPFASNMHIIRAMRRHARQHHLFVCTFAHGAVHRVLETQPRNKKDRCLHGAFNAQDRHVKCLKSQFPKCKVLLRHVSKLISGYVLKTPLYHGVCA